MNNLDNKNSSLLLSTNTIPIYTFRGVENKIYDEKTILNKEIIPNNGIIILNKKNVLTEESIQTAKMNINYSEVYKLILNPQLPKYHLSKNNISEEYSLIFSELQTSLSDYIEKQYKEMEKNIENYRKRLMLQFSSKKEKAGKEREALWNIICGINADNGINSNHKKIIFEPVMEVSNSLQSYHQQKSAYPIGSYSNNAKRFNDSNQFFTYHSYKMSSMASYAHNRSDIRPDTKNVFDVTAIKEELDIANNSETVLSDSINEDKIVDQKDAENNTEYSDDNGKNEKEKSTHELNDIKK